MANEPKIIADFPKCYHCGSTSKVSELGCAQFKENGKIAQDAFTSLRQSVVPIEQPKMAGVMIQAIATYYDVCGACGAERCTRSEVVMLPVTMQKTLQGGNLPPFFNKHN